MFGWFRKQRRRKLRQQSFPSEWQRILESNASFLQSYSAAEQAKIRQAIQVFVPEKNWEGCGGLQLSDEHRVTIAAQMARMTLHFDEEYFDQVQSILVYPDAYLAKSSDPVGGGVVVEGHSGRLGEAWYRGPVILSWSDVRATAQGHGHGRNVVIHEFAHQLDMRNDRYADGFPPMESATLARRWQAIMPEAFSELSEMCRQGIGCVIDCYGATNQSEFFAVISESYFEEPEELEHQWPEVFELLAAYYGPVPSM